MRNDPLAKLRIPPGSQPKLRDTDAARSFGMKKDKAKRAMPDLLQGLEELQYKMYADGRFGVLVVLQAIDAGGKDGAIRNVISAFNPQGCSVTSFKAPSSEELKHDFLWRIHQHAPRRGEVAVFNRSHYEDVLVARVDKLAPPKTLEQRYGQINEFERILTESGTRIVKLFLHIGREEQKARFQARLDKPYKQWKFDPADLAKRKQWDAYREAYERMLARCSTEWAPWHVIPADHKWFRDYAVAQILLRELQGLPLRFPALRYDPRQIRLR